MCHVHLIQFLIILYISTSYIFCCPEVCKCSFMKSSSSKSEPGQRVVCTPQTGFISWTDLQPDAIPNNTVHLSVQNTTLSVVPAFHFAALPFLKKLDLSKNNISEIKENAFTNLSSLEKLDLSHNRLAKLKSTVFQPLTSLLRLNLQFNLLSQFSEEQIKDLQFLKVLDISNNLLICDCHLRWLNEWVRSSKIRLPQKTSCRFPKVLQGTSFLRVSKKELHCQWPLQLPMFEIIPAVSQLVFEGDSLSLQCVVSNVIPDISIMWMLNDEVLQVSNISFTNITQSSPEDASIRVNTLHIEKIKPYHAGHWKCQVNSSRGNDSRSIELVVVANNGRVCPRTISVDSKGQYAWPETSAGLTVEIDCVGKRISNLDLQRFRAHHTCSQKGMWENLNTEQCPFISEVTNVLQQFAKANITFSQSNVMDSARLLRNYTSSSNLFKDKMDIIFVSQTLQNYIPVISHHHELAEIIVDVINTLLSLDRDLLLAAEVEDQACSRLLWILEQLPELLMDVPLNRIQENIAIEQFFVKAEGFPGITCSSFMQNNYVYSNIKNWADYKFTDDEKVLNCNVANSTNAAFVGSDNVEASLQLPSTIFQQASLNFPSSIHTHKLQFIIYRNSLLFPSSLTENHMNDITSSVISGKIAHFDVNNLSEPVLVSLRTAAYTDDVKPVWWDSQAIGGKGKWSDDGCFVLKVHNNVVTFSCNRLASFGLLQNVNALLTQYKYEIAQFRVCHPAIYIGSILCTLLLTAAFVLYCFAYKNLKMPGKAKHSIMNTFLSLTLLCGVFALGVPQTDIIPLCQGIGFMLHYLILCTLLWMLVSASNLYKEVVKTDKPDVSSTESIPEQPLPPKPMLRFYLVGWGIPSIIVGISAAVNIENYGGHKFCFLSISPCIGALYGPAILLLFILSCLYLLIRRGLQRIDAFNDDQKTIPTESTHADSEIAETTSGKRTSTYMEDEDIQSYESLLQGQATLLVLFFVMWICAAASVGRPFEDYVPNDELVFSILFCFASSGLGVYCFVFFCYCRMDTYPYVHRLLCKKLQNDKNFRLESMPMVVIENVVQSSDATRDIVDIKDKEHDQVAPSVFDSSSLQETSALAYSSSNSVNTAKEFYDPWQSVVARRFFEKNRRQQQLLNKNNIEKANASETNPNLKSSNTSTSSQVHSDCKSEPFISLKNSKCCSSKDRSILCPIDTERKLCIHSCSFSPLPPLKCNNLRKNICPVLLSDDSQYPASSIFHNCCSDVSTDILSFPSPKKQRSYVKRCKTDRHTRYGVKGCAGYSSFSTEDLKCSCHCSCRSRSGCSRFSNDVCNISKSDLTVASSCCTQSKVT